MSKIDSSGLPAALLKPREAAATLGISQRTLWAMTASGALRHVRIGRLVRYSAEDLRQFIEQQSQGGINEAKVISASPKDGIS